MAGVLSKKKKLFDPEPALPEQKLSVNIEEVENGYTVRCRGGKGDKSYDGATKVAKTAEEALEIAGKHFSKGDEKSEED